MWMLLTGYFLFQFTEEKFGQAEKTELDAHLENLLVRAETTKHWTEKIMKQTEVLLQPNPSKTTLLSHSTNKMLTHRTPFQDSVGQVHTYKGVPPHP